jgi:hypothetical protein
VLVIDKKEEVVGASRLVIIPMLHKTCLDNPYDE